VQSAAAHERASLLCDYLARTINTLLGHAPERVLDSKQALADLGIDSLACIRLGEQLARDLGVGVGVRAILAATLDSLAASLGAQMAIAPPR
jgi:aryl carrier-like protein